MLWQPINNNIRLYILDLDGTLMPSAEVDNQCYWQAVFECFGQQQPPPDIAGFRHVTDSGILIEWCARVLQRDPTTDETRQIKQRFLQLLQDASELQPEHFHPLAGVEDWLQAVEDDPHLFAAIATGGWNHTARLKLKLSGLDRFALPLASSDDAVARTEIMQIAAGQVQQLHELEATVICYVGDGIWDLQASRDLDWIFIGIAGGLAAERLRNSGAAYIQADFTRPESKNTIGLS